MKKKHISLSQLSRVHLSQWGVLELHPYWENLGLRVSFVRKKSIFPPPSFPAAPPGAIGALMWAWVSSCVTTNLLSTIWELEAPSLWTLGQICDVTLRFFRKEPSVFPFCFHTQTCMVVSPALIVCLLRVQLCDFQPAISWALNDWYINADPLPWVSIFTTAHHGWTRNNGGAPCAPTASP